MRIFGNDSALKERDFQLFFYSQAISAIGTWLQNATLGWLIFKISHSELLVGINGALVVAPAIILAPISGLVIDRFPTKKVLLATTVLAAIQATVLTGLAFIHPLGLPEIFILTAVLGVFNAFDGPARHTSIAEIVLPEDIPSATALNSTLVNIGVMLGTALAGLLIWLVGPSITFLVNALSYIPVLSALLQMHFKHASHKQTDSSWKQLWPGFKHVFMENTAIRNLLILLFLCLAFAFSYRQLMPAVTKVMFGGDAVTFGLLGAMPGFGSIVAGIFTSRAAKKIPYQKLVAFGMSLAGICLVLFAAVRQIWLAIPLLFLAGFGSVVAAAMLRARIQVLAKTQATNLLGRITSFNQMAFLGGLAFGNTAIGKLAQQIGLPHAILACGLCLIAISAVITLFQQNSKESKTLRTES